ncbi:MAG: hypothetical protein ACYCXT_11070 [Acidiferrobacteraceae bacterium]
MKHKEKPLGARRNFSLAAPDLSKLQELRVEAAQELGKHGDLARARERDSGMALER